ncbi:MAG TPA: hypothetical protein VLB74_07300 [Flavobacterium sp.]|uniref:hypothetical protein n=1 Tax=Flavobacterium sp. TaxID=239 RepID=UPI002CD3E399|nr:hypothetical protein [Flavobacterium sp.]HSD14439.1 hypothetical protein [Flavobacterium sp.]
MKNGSFIRKILFVGLLLVFFSCDKDEYSNNSPEGTASTGKDIVNPIIYGDEVEVGKGTVKSWISVDEFGKPLEIGIEMTPSVLENLPIDSDFEKTPIIPIPKEASVLTAFDHIGLNWNPDNYSTISGFKVPHFSVYFYLISENERKGIPEWSEETDPLFSFYPPKNHMPAVYSPIDKAEGSLATIGRHWLNQYEGPLETHTLRLGTFNGRFAFVNPVVALDFLKSEKKANGSIPQGVENPSNNMLPREYHIYTNEKGNYSISLGNFINR